MSKDESDLQDLELVHMSAVCIVYTVCIVDVYSTS